MIFHILGLSALLFIIIYIGVGQISDHCVQCKRRFLDKDLNQYQLCQSCYEEKKWFFKTRVD